MAGFGESCRRCGHGLAAEIDPERKPPVRCSIRDNVGNSRPATAPDPLLDHLVGGGQQRFGDHEAERLRGLEVDNELELSRYHHRKVGGLFALEDAAGGDTQSTPNPEGTCATAGASDRRWPARRRWRPQDHRAARENAGLRRLIDHHTNQVAFVVAQPPGASWRLCEAFSCACLKR
jgi:hypothetical protein